MFDQTLKKAAIIGFMTPLAVLGATSSAIAAGDTATPPAWKSQGGTIPVTVTLAGIKSTAGPVYVSIQKRHQFMGMKGHGGLIPKAELGEMTAEYMVDAAGEYSVSIWHDINDDGVFSMDAAYNILDGWGNSAAKPIMGPPKFDDMKVSIPSTGKAIEIEMKYPN